MLRKAATLMRERATTAPIPAGPWEREFSDAIRTDIPFGSPGYLIAECATNVEAEHIASWHPAVALAVADWLEFEANVHEASVRNSAPADHRLSTQALAVARAYLGESS